MNLAKGKPTKQSSTDQGGLSSRAVDGNANSHWLAKSSTLTKISLNPWWRVDLRRKVRVGLLKVTARSDCNRGGKGANRCPKMRLVEIRVGNVDNNPMANAV